MSTWITVTKRHETHGVQPAPEPTECSVNADLIHTVEPTANGAVLGWFTGGPRATWRVVEPRHEIIRRIQEAQA